MSKRLKTEDGSGLARQHGAHDANGDDTVDAVEEYSHKQVSRDLYLDTVRRNMLDFDFEKVCSVSLSNLNVYACLVCGKYFQGRGKSSHAYTHSLHEDHHVFVNLHTLKFYVLPESYEVNDPSLGDIKHVLNPTFTPREVAQLDTSQAASLTLSRERYWPGYVGLNNAKANDYVNAVVQSLIHITPLRDFFLLQDVSTYSALTMRFGALVRKMWNPRAFKGQVSPHELLQAIDSTSKRRFKFTEQGDPAMLLPWFLNALHADIKDKKSKSSVIHEAMQGEVEVKSQAIGSRAPQDLRLHFDGDKEMSKTTTPFLFLTLDLPPQPLFQAELEQNIIPQVALSSLLAKYNGQTVQQYGDTIKQYRLVKLPQYLVFHVKRFVKNNFSTEKNPTIVNYAIKNLDMREYVPTLPSEPSNKYNLIANICHDGPADGGVYRAHVLHKGLQQWFSIQDLRVEEIMPQMILLSESYIQVWERADA
ncbi:Ubiquitin carboxyl-terminal hydrolase 10 [Sorochytrium milnesiophthora]